MSDYPPMIMQYPDDLEFWKRIKLPWTKPPLSMNDASPASRGAVYGRAAKKREIQELLHLLGRGLSMPEGKHYLLVQMNYRVPDKRRRDTDNVTASSKPLMDALSGGSKRIPGLGLVDDDTPYFMGSLSLFCGLRFVVSGARCGLIYGWLRGRRFHIGNNQPS